MSFLLTSDISKWIELLRSDTPLCPKMRADLACLLETTVSELSEVSLFDILMPVPFELSS